MVHMIFHSVWMMHAVASVTSSAPPVPAAGRQRYHSAGESQGTTELG